MEDLSRQELHARFISDVAQLHQNTLQDTVDRLQSPEATFSDVVWNSIHQSKFAILDTESGLGRSAAVKPPGVEGAARYVRRLAEEEGIDANDPNDARFNLKVIQAISHRLKDRADDPLELARGIYTLSELAGINKPSAIHRDNIFKKQAKESSREKVFRCAVIALAQRDKLSDEEKEILKLVEAQRLTLDSSPLLADIKRAPATVTVVNKIQSFNVRKNILEKLLEEGLTGRDISDEYHVLLLMQDDDTDKTLPAQPEVPVRQTEWTILPKQLSASDDVHEALAKTAERTMQGEDGSGAKIDPKRVQSLGELAISWGEEAYLVISNLKTGSNTRHYMGAVLPQTLSDERVIYHFVADNPNLENALYVWRAENGIDPETGEVVRTWEDVFDQHRTQARELGAKRFNHSPTIGERVLEYLTRNPAELDK